MKSNPDNNTVNEPNSTSEGLKPPFITQLDMAVTQFCFMGFIPLFPNQLGISFMNKEDKGLRGFLHIWAIFGHFLGIQPEYNIALPENADKRDLIWNQILLPAFTSCHPDSIHLWGFLIHGLCAVLPLLSLKAMVLFAITR
jgi:hypothetical protein